MLQRIDHTESLRRRLLPLHATAALQGFALWIPIEKLFMTEIGFDAAAVGVMAAAYAAVPPLVEIPSGILADRWSRRGVLVVSSVALLLCSLIGGLSTDVPTYIVSALVLGVYFAMYSGTMDSVVYDTVLEETGERDSLPTQRPRAEGPCERSVPQRESREQGVNTESATFERHIGRVRLVNSVALVVSALAGGWLAELATPRLTYFLTVPFAALSIVALLRFREPRLHESSERTSLKAHVTLTVRTVLRRGELLPIVALLVLTALILQVVFEFGPLWLVALAAAPVVYGPFTAGMTATLGLGGVLAGRLRLDRPLTVGVVVGVLLVASVVLNRGAGIAVVTITQVLLALLLVALSIHLTRLLHDAVPSEVRAGVASGVGALSWIAFLPFALVFGVVSEALGVHAAGWMITVVVAVTGVLLMTVVRGRRTAVTRPVEAVASA